MTSDLSFTIICERKVTTFRREDIYGKGCKGKDTRNALQTLSQNGYAGTNVRELTASLGLVKSSLYKHFESKEAIWNALLDQMIAYYDERFGSSV